jgi:AAA15 family ATPase/GTPase
MQLIKSIEIHRFRSIANTKIEISDINIFSGRNNCGKSNILRALNLFFNSETTHDSPYSFSKDYNVAFTGQATGKREIKITIHFLPTGKGALRHEFSIARIFDDSSTIDTIYSSSNETIQESLDRRDGTIRRQFTRFLNKIRYIYVPAVRDKTFIKSLFLNFEEVVKNTPGEALDKKLDELSEVIATRSRGIGEEFSRFLNLPTKATLSAEIKDTLASVDVEVFSGIQITRRRMGKPKIEDIPTSIFSSGDGVLMSYLAYFLSHLSKKSINAYYVWGFEEPENSLEYTKVQQLAQAFVSDFSKHAQILLTTHSHAFISLSRSEGCRLFRVFIKHHDVSSNAPNKKATEVVEISRLQQLTLKLADVGNLKTDEYELLARELHLVEFSQEIEDAVTELIERRRELQDQFVMLENTIRQTRTPIVFVEGKYDIRFIQKAAELLSKIDLLNLITIKEANGKGGLKKMRELRNTALAHALHCEILLLPDCDVEGEETQDEGKFYWRKIPLQSANPIQKGIENLFPKSTIDRVIAADVSLVDRSESYNKTKNGTTISVPESYTINHDKKKDFCDWLCKNGTANDFTDFSVIFDCIELTLFSKNDRNDNG